MLFKANSTNSLVAEVQKLTAISLIAFAGAQQSIAQTDESNETPPTEEVIVTGIRKSLQDSIDNKRDADQFKDVISAEDIGKLPDANIAEAMQRITGVQISRDSLGEGQSFQIRGLSSNRVEIDGRSLIGNDSDTRSNSFNGIASALFSGVEVIKSPSASDTEGALGGTVRLKARKPLSSKEITSGTFELGYDKLQADEIDPKASFVISRALDIGGKRLGLLGAISYEDFHSQTDQFQSNEWEPITPAQRANDADFPEGVTVLRPRVGRIQQFNFERKRIGFDGTVEFEPSDNLNFYLTGNIAQFETLNNQHKIVPAFNQGFVRIGVDPEDITQAYTNPTTGDEYLFLLQATAETAQPRVNPTNDLSDQEQYAIAAGASWDNGPWHHKAEFASTASESFSNNININFTRPNTSPTVDENNPPQANDWRTATSGTFDFSQGTNAPPSFSWDFAEGDNVSFTNPDGWQLTGFWSRDTWKEASEDSFKYDMEFEVNKNIFTDIKAGVRIAERNVNRFQRGNDGASDRIPEFGPLFSATLYQDLSHSVQNLIEVFDNPILPGQGGNFPREWFSLKRLDTADFEAFRQEIDGGRQFRVIEGYPFDITEDSTALYVQADFENTDFSWPFRGNFGLRYIQTDVSSKGEQLNPDTGEFFQVQKESDYNKILPSANISFEMTEDMILRFALARVMTRPDPKDLSSALSLGGNSLSGSTGNPDLAPYLADQFDIAYEWYFAESSMLNFQIFNKELDDFKITTSRQEIVGNVDRNDDGMNGVAPGDLVTISYPINGSGGSIRGWETGFQHSFTSLPEPWDGIGFVANYTYTDRKGDSESRNKLTDAILPPEQLSETSYNFIIFYEKYGFSARLAYNWRDEFLSKSFVGRAGLSEWTEDYGQLDLNIEYDIDDNFSVFLNGSNITDQIRTRYTGDPRAIIEYRQTGARFNLGLRARF